MRKRVDQLGVAEPEIQRSGEDQIDVSLPDVENADEAASAGRHHRAALLLRLGEERPGPGLQAGPGEPERHGRPGRRQRGRGHQPLRRGQAREHLQAARLRRRVDHASSTSSTTRPRRSSPGPGESEADVRARGCASSNRQVRAAARRGSSTVPQGTVVVRAEQADPDAAPPNRWYVLRDAPALSGADIKNPEQNFDQRAGRHRPAERHLRVHRQGPRGVAEDRRARSPSAARRTSSAATRRPPTSTSRSCWTTS